MKTSQQNEKGFTLVELAIVLVIVGLLIGGILKGQALIANAQVTATINQMTGLDAATSTFRDKYNGFPGDLLDADERLPNCTGACASITTDGNGQIDVTAGTVPTATDEALAYFLMLRADGLVTGFTGSSTIGFGEGLPPASVGGGFFAGFSTGSDLEGVTTADARRGHYIAVAGDTAGNVSTTNGAFSPAQGSRVDNKIDDGDPTTGAVIGADGCVNASNAYDGASESSACAIYYRIQG